MKEAARNFNDYLQLTPQTNNEMYALAHYNLGYIAFHQKDYAQGTTLVPEIYISWRKEKTQRHWPMRTTASVTATCMSALLTKPSITSQAEAMNTPAGDYSFYQLALVSGLQKDYSGKITLLNRLAGKYPSSPYAVSALYEKGRSYVLMDNNQSGHHNLSRRTRPNKYPESPVSRKAAAEIGLLYYQNEDYQPRH